MLSRKIIRKQRGRRGLTAVAGAVLIIGTFMLGNIALAVNATGAFELDGNAITDHSGTGKPDDADRVCYQDAINAGLTSAQATARCTATSGTNGASAVQWIDATADLQIFTGGGSKDPQDPGNDWLWKPADTVPDKDTIDHAFAARYSLAPDPTNCPSSDATCEVIFFGVDRFDNSGDAQLGFWFFKGTVGLTNTALSGGFKFSGHHQNGDLLVISDFSGGGTTSTIAAYFWDTTCGSDHTPANKIYTNPTAGQCGANNLRLQKISTAANCKTSSPSQAFCGIVNPTNGTTAPWPYTDKSGNHSYLQGEYYEAGLNLSSLGLGGACFSSFEGESRSSTSPTATLKDFVLGNFQNCSATAITAPTAGAITPVSPGSPVSDHIYVIGAGGTTPPFPSSPPNVVFSMCGPIATGTCDGTDTAHTGVAFGATKALTPTAVQGKSEATSDQVNTSGSPLLPGRYCFSGSWAGDANYPTGASDSSTGECFTVATIPTTTVTTPSDSSGTALTSPVAFGTTLYDKAVVTGTAAGGNPPGAVNFFLCDPTQTTGASGAEVCATGGTALSGNPRALVADAGSSPPTSTVLSSPGVVGNIAGVWCFRAEYVPSGTTYTGSSDASHGECVQVGQFQTTTVTDTSAIGTQAVNAHVTDHAVVTGSAADGTPNGTITFYICDPAHTSGAAGSETCAAGTGTQVGNIQTATAIANSNPPKSEATTSTFVTANQVGVWCFRAEYAPSGANSGNYIGSSDATHAECFLVQDSTGATSAQNWLPNDSATITAAGGTALNGTLSFTLYPGGSCTGTPLYEEDTDAVTSGVQPYTLTNAASPVTRVTHNTSVLVSASSTVSWKVVFTSSDPNVGSSNHCESTVLTIAN